MFLCFLAFFVSFFIVTLAGKRFICILQKWQIGQVIRQEGPESHYSKKGTPTMGGLLILASMIITSLLFANLHSPLVVMSLVTLILFGAIGFYDDYAKLILKHSKGLASRWKYFWQSVFALGLGIWFYHYFKHVGYADALLVPFMHGYVLPLSTGIFLFLAYFTLAGGSNAVNLTDGLDGLAILSIILVTLGMVVLILVGTSLPPETRSLLPVLVSLIGAGLGFWWLNGFPALLFMGDVGALAIGAFLAFVAISIRAELFFALMGGIFVIETLSVILQVASYKLRNKKRIFKMSPIHHHFELSGWPEARVVARFTIITALLVVLALFAYL